MKIRYFLFAAVLVTAVLCSVGSALAQTVTSMDCMSNLSSLSTADQITCLQQTISSLMQQIAAIQAQQGTTSSPSNGGTSSSSWCYTFTQYLKPGDTDNTTNDEVMNLVTALQQSGFVILHGGTGLPDVFSSDTISVLKQFQAKYRISQTGTTGPITRAKLNALYGCGRTPTPTPVCITGTTQPCYGATVQTCDANGQWPGCSAPICPSGQAWNGGMNLCMPNCPLGQMWNSNTNICIASCPTGQIWNVPLNSCVSGNSTTPSVALNVAGGSQTPTIQSGTSVDLMWTSVNANEGCSIASTPNDASITITNKLPANNTITVKPTTSTVYTVTCYHVDGNYQTTQASNSVTINVLGSSTTPSITLTSPTASNVSWQRGSLQAITWAPSGQAVDIYLANGNNVFNGKGSLLLIGGQTGGTFPWSAGNWKDGTTSIAPDGDYRVAVCPTGKDMYDSSCGSFYLNIFTSAQPSIILGSSPLYGNMDIGTTFSINGTPQGVQGLSYWAGIGNPPAGYYSRAFFFDPMFNGSCINNDASSNVWSITCTAKTAGTGNFYVEIYANGQVYKSNVITVTVNPLKPLIIVTSPVAGAPLQAGQPTDIAWMTSGIPQTDQIQLSYEPAGLSSGQSGPVIATTANTSQLWHWYVPAGITAGQYRIKAVDVTAGQVYGYGNYFTVSVPSPSTTTPSVTITSPNGGEMWYVGETHNITWTPNSLGTGTHSLDMSLVNWAGSVTSLASPDINSGSYSWTVPSLTSGNYYFKFSIDQNVSINSNIINILPASTQPPTTVTQPNGGMSLVNSTASGSAIAGGDFQVSCDFGVQLPCITATTIPIQNTSWRCTSEGFNGTAAMFDCSASRTPVTSPFAQISFCNLITSSADSRCTNQSFQIPQATYVTLTQSTSLGNSSKSTSSGTPSFTFTSPAGGEQWAQGSTQNITWTANGINQATIFLGNTTIAQNISGSGSYSWMVPSTLATGQYQIGAMSINQSTAGVPGTPLWFSSNSFSVVAPTTSMNVSQNSLASISSALANIMKALQGLVGK